MRLVAASMALVVAAAVPVAADHKKKPCAAIWTISGG